MSATNHVIVSTPVDAAIDVDALRREFRLDLVKHNWHPRLGLISGVLHITHMHPGDLEDFGVTGVIVRGWKKERATA